METNYDLISVAVAGVLSGALAALIYPIINRYELYEPTPKKETKEYPLESSLSEIPLWKQPGKGHYGSKKYR